MGGDSFCSPVRETRFMTLKVDTRLEYFFGMRYCTEEAA